MSRLLRRPDDIETGDALAMVVKLTGPLVHLCDEHVLKHGIPVPLEHARELRDRFFGRFVEPEATVDVLI